MELISYGIVCQDFKVMAQMVKLLKRINNKEIKETRLDCYSINSLRGTALDAIVRKFQKNKLPIPINIEVFKPSENYPLHVDDGGMSYFIGLESGIFSIEGVNYPIIPFVLYSFDDSKPHNTNFAAIMLK